MEFKTTTSSNSDLFHNYLHSLKDEVQTNATDGYYHVNVVAEAYSKGLSDGKKLGKEEFFNTIISDEIEKFTQKANQIYILSKRTISFLKEQKFDAKGLYINLRPSRSSVIISVDNSILNDDKFVEIGYQNLFESKKIFEKLFNESLDIGFMSNDNLDENLLKEDGFGYIENY